MNDEIKTTILGENDSIRLVSRDAFRNRKMEEVAEVKEVLDERARVAVDLLRAWGMATGKRGPEDAAGRSSIDLMPVAEVVDRAIGMTEMAFKEMKHRGWIVSIDRVSIEEAERAKS